MTLLAEDRKPEDRVLDFIMRGFAPLVGVITSKDTEDIMLNKKLTQGFIQLIRPFGDNVAGSVSIRDGVGVSHARNNFGIRFAPFHYASSNPSKNPVNPVNGYQSNVNHPLTSGHSFSIARNESFDNTIRQIEQVVDFHLTSAPQLPISPEPSKVDCGGQACPNVSLYYLLYLQRLLSSSFPSSHETFAHPVACIIVISSRNEHPIDELRSLNASTTSGSLQLPAWMGNDYLRYYVLVHDEDRDDITRSLALFEQIKRSFGLHCHLLRLRSHAVNPNIAPLGEECVELGDSKWISASEELALIQSQKSHEIGDNKKQYIFSSDVSALQNFVREMVVQSLIPTMERYCMFWNEQIVSRRRGLTGKLASLSKRWAPFSSGRSSGGSLYGAMSGSSANVNYDSVQGFYRPDSSEAIMRKLADFCFMLRDFKLAHVVYDLLRQDFEHDKAWKYHAGANEMTAISSLMLLNVNNGTRNSVNVSKIRFDNIENQLETAIYSYMNRCLEPHYTLRTIIIGMELIRVRNATTNDTATRLANRILDLNYLGRIGHVVFVERVVECLKLKDRSEKSFKGARRRKAAFWSLIAAERWLEMNRFTQADRCISDAIHLYQSVLPDSISREAGDAIREHFPLFPYMNWYLKAIKDTIVMASKPDTPASPSIEELTDAHEQQMRHYEALSGLPSV